MLFLPMADGIPPGPSSYNPEIQRAQEGNDALDGEKSTSGRLLPPLTAADQINSPSSSSTSSSSLNSISSAAASAILCTSFNPLNSST